MKRIFSPATSMFWAITLVCAAASTSAAMAEPIKVVFVKEGQIFYRAGLEAADIQLTREDSIKFLPVWSRDGRRIAFAEKGAGNGLGRLVVMDERGRRLGEIELEAGGGGEAMRYIESLEWVSATRLAVGGSASPSLTETRLVDLDDLDAQESIFDDGTGADFSPDGRHFAYTTGSPHFTPEEFREPALNIDFRRVFPEAGARVRFLTERVWSPDGEKLAVVTEDVPTGALELVIWRAETGLEVQAVGLRANEVVGLVWSSETILLRTSTGLARLTDGGRVEPWKSVSPEEGRRGADLRQSLSMQLERSGLTFPDFWCESCALAALDRKAVFRQ